MTSSFSGLPKFRQSVSPSGVAPTQERFRAASATAAMPPVWGSRWQYRPLQSTVRASPLEVPLMRTTAASAPGASTVLLRTKWSYCR